MDVLVGLHGDDLVNAMFMRPGTSLVEIRPAGWWGGGPKGLPATLDFWANTILQKMWYTNSTFYWWYGANETESSFSDAEPAGLPTDVRVVWSRLKCTLTKVLATRGLRAYEARTDFGDVECTSSIQEDHAGVSAHRSTRGVIRCSRTSISILRALDPGLPLHTSDKTRMAFERGRA